MESLLPFAENVATGTSSCAILNAVVRPGASQGTLLPSDVSGRCVALDLLERLLSTCTKRGQDCFLSVVAVDDTRNVLDLLSPETRSRPKIISTSSPEEVPTSSSCCLLFPDAERVCITGMRRPGNLLHRALQCEERWRQNYTLVAATSIAVVVSVEAVAVKGCTICPQQQRQLVLIEAPTALVQDEANSPLWLQRHEQCEPLLNGHPLAHLLYGLCMSHRCGVVFNDCPTVDGAINVVPRCFNTSTYPNQRWSDFRGDCMALTREVMLLRLKVNAIAAEFSAAEVLHQQLADDFRCLVEHNHALELIKEKDWELPMHQMDDVATKSWELRWKLLRAAEILQEQDRHSLDELRAGIMLLPVINSKDSAATAHSGVDIEVKTKILEATVNSQEHELNRLKGLLQRVLEEQRNQRATTTAIDKQQLPSHWQPLQFLIDAFSEECHILLENPPALATALKGLLQRLSVDLEANVGWLVQTSSSSSIDPVMSTGEAVDQLQKKFFDQLRRSLGIPITFVDGTPPPGRQWFEMLVKERIACRVERCKIHSVTEVIKAQLIRVLNVLNSLSSSIVETSKNVQRPTLVVRHPMDSRVMDEIFQELQQNNGRSSPAAVRKEQELDQLNLSPLDVEIAGCRATVTLLQRALDGVVSMAAYLPVDTPQDIGQQQQEPHRVEGGSILTRQQQEPHRVEGGSILTRQQQEPHRVEVLLSDVLGAPSSRDVKPQGSSAKKGPRTHFSVTQGHFSQVDVFHGVQVGSSSRKTAARKVI